ncbi:MAG: hypothetical protein WAW06_01500, partial [bacterium]
LELGVLDLTPEVTLTDFVARLENSDGIFGWATGHGLIGPAVEAYEYTQSGWYECQAAYDAYLSIGYESDEIAPDWHETDGYHIAVKPALISRRYRSASSIVYVAACNSMTYAGAWVGAREVLGYSGTVSNSLTLSEANTFWSRMNGEYGKAYRHVGGAQSGLTLARTGPGGGNTVLSPTVESCYPPEGTAIGKDSVAAGLVFDTKMDLSLDPHSLMKGDTHIRVKNEGWSRGLRDTLKYVLKSILQGTGAILASGKSEGQMMLDGNLSPYGTDGMGPNGDGYYVSYACTYTDPNVAARFGSQWAYLDAGDVVVGWDAEAEHSTKAYLVETGDGSDWESGWVTVGRVLPGQYVAPGIYSVRVPAGHKHYRVVEIDGMGARCVFHPLTVLSAKPEGVEKLVEAAKRLSRPEARAIAASGHCCAPGAAATTCLSGSVPDWVFYGPDSLLAECGPAVAWLESNGLEVDLVAATSPDY